MVREKNSSGFVIRPSCIFLIIGIICLSPLTTQAQQGSNLEKAQWLFQHENYEEALALLKELSAAQPQSSEVAYYIGMTYKRLQDFLAAKPYLVAAGMLVPNEKNAFLELIDLLYQCEELNEAKKWIEAAKKESVNPAQLAFFNGLVLLKEGADPLAAINSFDEAQKLNSSLAQSVKYQKGLAYAQLNLFKEAKYLFQDIVDKNPSTDLARFANEYIDALTRRQNALKKFHASIGYSLQYDDNVVFRPNDNALARGVTEDSDWVHVFTSQGEYNFKIKDNFSIKAGASYYGTKHDRIGFYDINSFDLPIQPIFYTKNAAVAFPIHYNYVAVNEKKYLGTIGLSNLNNLMLGSKNMLQLQLQYNIKDYHWAVSDPQDVKKGSEYLGAIGWFYFFAKNRQGVLNVRYAINFDDTEGNNSRYRGNRLTFSSVIPINKKLQWNFVGDVFHQDFSKDHSAYRKRRQDNVFTIVNLFAYKVSENAEVQLQHTFVDDIASIAEFKYRKNIYSAGVKYRF